MKSVEFEKGSYLLKPAVGARAMKKGCAGGLRSSGRGLWWKRRFDLRILSGFILPGGGIIRWQACWNVAQRVAGPVTPPMSHFLQQYRN